MEDYESATSKIRSEIKGDLSDVRREFLEHFESDAERFVDLMARAFLRWSELDRGAGQDLKKANVSGLVFSAVTQHIISLRLFLSGYIVSAGNTQRQVLETIALALLKVLSTMSRLGSKRRLWRSGRDSNSRMVAHTSP